MINPGKILTSIVIFMTSIMAKGEYNLNYDISLTAGVGNGDFAPYYISSLEGGRYVGVNCILPEAKIWRPLDASGRFSYAFGIDVLAGYASSVDYERYDRDEKSWAIHDMRQNPLRIQQLYAQMRYRSIFLTAGSREHSSALLNQKLTSGDLVESGNSRPIPQIRAGLIDFRDIPFTDGWVQIQGEVAYGKLIDNDWWREHYNYYNQSIAINSWYNYKRVYFRTKPSQPLSVTVGMQAAGQFGGYTTWYEKGIADKVEHHDSGIKTFFKMLLPTGDGGEGFYTGNHLGAWDFKARYRLNNGQEISAYFSWPFEDGSGIGKQNGWDGLWGIEYRNSRNDNIIRGALIEYLDFTNQSGPIHYNPDDWPGSTITGHTSGSDDYYNNAAYNSYAYFGQSIGTPALMAPIYNLDGYNKYEANVMRGFHIGVEGCILPGFDYIVKGGYRKAWGNGYFMLPKPIHLTSVMAGVTWSSTRIKGLSVNAKIEIDRGNMPASSFGALVTVRYKGLLNLKL